MEEHLAQTNRYFTNRVEALDITVVVVNTLKFTVVNESVKKTDRHDASTFAEFVERDMLPEARLCSRESEELRRLLKVRSSLVRTIVGVKNQMHRLLLSLGIESRRGDPPSCVRRWGCARRHWMSRDPAVPGRTSRST